MKLFIVLFILASAYMGVMLKTTDTVLTQTEKLHQTYQDVADNSEKIAAGQ